MVRLARILTVSVGDPHPIAPAPPEPARRVRILDDQPECAAVRAFIDSGLWRNPGAFRRIPTRNPRYEVHALALPGTSTPCILKIAQAAPASYPPARRFNAWASHLIRDPSRRALEGARALAAAGLPTIRPLACWTARRTGRWRDSFLLYAAVPALRSLRDVKLEAEARPSGDAAQALPALAERLADLVARLHARGLRHNDLACGNVLVGEDGALHLIDTDHVHRARRFGLPALKRFFDLNDLRRLDLDEPLRRAVLRRYLGGRDSAFWWRVHLYWRHGGNRPFRWLRHRLFGRS